MGLDIRLATSKHIGRAGSYSGFNDFRKWLADKVGINLSEMVGFGGDKEWDSSIPLYAFLSHSDCDGKLNYDECVMTRDGLDAVRAGLDVNDKDNPMVESLGEWIDWCDEAISTDGELIFS